MKKIIASLLIGLFAFPLSPARAALSEPDRALIGPRNVLVNPGFESSTAGWTVTGGTLSTTTTAPGSGNASAVFTPSATGQSLASGYKSVISGDGLSSMSGAASCRVKWVSGATQVKIEAFDGTNALGSNTVTLPVSWTRIYSLPFSFGVSGSFRLQVTSTGSGSYDADDCYFGLAEGVPGAAQLGMAGSNWNSFTMVIGAVTTAPTEGTGVTKKAFWRRVGNSMQIKYSYVQTGAGTGGSGDYLFPIPSPYSIDLSQEAGTQTANVGDGNVGAASTATGNGNVQVRDSTHLAIQITTDTLAPFFIGSASGGLANASVRYNFLATVPIAGWDANVSIGASSTYRVSSFLANGSRVVGTAPANLGEYRSYLRNASARTFTETNGAPTPAPSASDGVKLWGGGGWAAADAANSPSRYEIFVGKNKQIKLETYSSSGRTGVYNPQTITNWGGTTDVGTLWSYDPTTGIVSIVANYSVAGTNSFGAVGVDAGSSTALASGYFDLVVSENALAVGVQVPRSEVQLDTYASYGSTNTNVFNFTTTTVSTGTALSSVSSNAASGASITILEPGVYAISASAETPTGGSQELVISKNAITSDMTGTDPATNIPASRRLAYAKAPAISAAFTILSASRTTNLNAGDVVRLHGDTSVPATSANLTLAITKVSN